VQTGAGFVDFTPSVGARLPAIEALAEAHEVPVAGSDGKTGETFMKSVLAPALGQRNLKVRSWSGMNILGGGDGAALADPTRVQSKLNSKGKLLDEILGYPVEAPIHIEDVRDMGEWKTAWDHIVFEGFLGVRMKLQFTWEGCDSTLAAPLLLDLMRLMGMALERRERGVMANLAFFFKDPAGTREHALHRQYEMLERWVAPRVAA
jgi:myo-inositol-1-phosphate synthase